MFDSGDNYPEAVLCLFLWLLHWGLWIMPSVMRGLDWIPSMVVKPMSYYHRTGPDRRIPVDGHGLYQQASQTRPVRCRSGSGKPKHRGLLWRPDASHYIFRTSGPSGGPVDDSASTLRCTSVVVDIVRRCADTATLLFRPATDRLSFTAQTTTVTDFDPS